VVDLGITSGQAGLRPVESGSGREWRRRHGLHYDIGIHRVAERIEHLPASPMNAITPSSPEAPGVIAESMNKMPGFLVDLPRDGGIDREINHALRITNPESELGALVHQPRIEFSRRYSARWTWSVVSRFYQQSR
jgi:hypothetical protein